MSDGPSSPEGGPSQEEGLEQLHPSVVEFISKVKSSMTPEESLRLPSGSDYNPTTINAVTGKALDNLDQFGNDLTKAVVGNYYESPYAERFIQDPRTGGPLFVDGEGALITMNGVEFGKGDRDVGGVRKTEHYIASYTNYDVLTGPKSGQRFTHDQRPLPEPSRTPPLK